MVAPKSGDRPTHEGRRIDPSRREQHRDADRVLYSSEFRRLAGVTQVTSPQDDYVYHDRLTHSLKVGQVGMRLAQRLLAKQNALAKKSVDADVVYAASLAHDIGHPPFGHASEAELQRVLAGQVRRDGEPGNGITILGDSFEGNAQSFRIVTRLSFRKLYENVSELDKDHDPSASDDEQIDELADAAAQLGLDRTFTGLNLTWETLFAIQKYPWLYKEGPTSEKLANKWGFYQTERDYYERMLEVFPRMAQPGERSINAQIMDWADDIAYAIHDSEDFYKAGLIPLERLRHDEGEWARFTSFAMAKALNSMTGYLTDPEEQDEVRAEVETIAVSALVRIRSLLPPIHFDGSRLAHHHLHRFATKHIEQLSRAASLTTSDFLEITRRGRFVAEILKSLATYYVHRTPALYAAQQGQARVVRELFFDLWDIVRADRSFGPEVDQQFLPSTVLPARLWEFCQHAVTDVSMNSAGSRDARLARAVVDFICSLTDRQATLLNERLTGNSVGQLSPYWLTV